MINYSSDSAQLLLFFRNFVKTSSHHIKDMEIKNLVVFNIKKDIASTFYDVLCSCQVFLTINYSVCCLVQNVFVFRVKTD